MPYNHYRDYLKNWRKANPDKVKAYNRKSGRSENATRYRRDFHLRKNYGITLNEYNAMLEIQNHMCAVCKHPQTSKGCRLSVDHCHRTGKVRGLLCVSCNAALGLVKESTDTLIAAVEYLNASKT